MALEHKKLHLTKARTPGMITAECGAALAAAGAVSQGAKGAVIGGMIGLLVGYAIEELLE